MVVEEVEQIDLGANVSGQVKVVEKVCSTNRRDFGVNVPGRVMLVEEVAQTVFGVNVPNVKIYTDVVQSNHQ